MVDQLPDFELLPLGGIRVVEFGTYIAGPLTSRILVDAGASCTAVIPPSGPSWDHEVNNLLNRGKTLVTIDLKAEDGKQAAFKLIKDADVIVENYAPGVMDRLGIGAERIRKEYPGIIYLSLPGFSSRDDVMKDVKAFEGIILSFAGVFTDMGLNRTLMGVNPSYSPLPLASTYGAVMGALGVVMSLIARDRCNDRQGDRIEAPLCASLCDCQIYNTMATPGLPERYLTLREREIARRKASKTPMDLSYAGVKILLDPFYHTYICQDGRPFYIVAPCHAIHQERVLRALGVWDEVSDGLPKLDVYLDSADWGKGIHAILGTYPLTDPAIVDHLKSKMQEGFQKRPASEWESIFTSMKIPGAKTRTLKEWINCRHALASGLIVEREWVINNKKVKVKEAGPVVWSERTKVPTTQHMREVGKQKIRAAFNRREAGDNSWMAGLRVVDLCNVIAGPTIGGVMARFGATVIKVDPTKPTYDPLVAVFMGLPINTGKESLLANLSQADGKEILTRLVKWADVVLTNQIDSQLHVLGTDEQSLKAINPNVILTVFNGYGGPRFGPRSEAVAYDDVLQAATGIMARFGGSLETPEEHAHLGTIDVVSGFSGALTTCLAIYKLLKTGQADVARTSLASNAQLIQTPFMYDYDGRKPFDEPHGAQANGENDSLIRWYSTVDGHIFVAATPLTSEASKSKRNRVLQAISEAIGVSSDKLVGKSTAEQSSIIGGFLAELETAEAVKAIRATGISAVAPHSMSELCKKFTSKVERFSRMEGDSGPDSQQTLHFHSEPDHPIGLPVTMFAPCSILSETVSVPIPSPAAKYGEHTRKILTTILGFTSDEANDMIASGAAGEEWSKKYLPGGDPWAEVEDEYKNLIAKASQMG